MAMERPPLDPRTEQDLIEQAETLAAAWTAWRPSPEGELDLGGALIRSFARIARHAQDALNAAPDANHAAFVELLGLTPRPPLDARVPLQFTLSTGAREPARVPAGTRAAAPADDAHAAEAVYTTQSDLMVVPAGVAHVLVHQPARDALDDRGQAARDGGEAWSALQATGRMSRRLSLACDALVGRADLSGLTLTLRSSAAAPMDRLDWEDPEVVSWWQAGPEGMQASSPERVERSSEVRVSVEWAGPMTCAPVEIDGVEALWLELRLESRCEADTPMPELEDITLTAALQRSESVRAATLDSAPLDLSADFLPFGEQPRYNQSFNLALPIDLSEIPGATIELTFQVSDYPPGGTITPGADLILRWECLTASGWVTLGRADGGATDSGSAYSFADGTDRLSTDGVVQFTLPEGAVAARRAGTEACWVRARIVSGTYGQAATVSVVDGVSTWVPATLAPPGLASAQMRYSASLSATPGSAERPLRVKRILNGEAEAPALPFTPFLPTEQQEQALYLAFDPPLPQAPISLYLQVQPPEPVQETPGGVDGAESPELAWELLGPEGWSHLHVEDGTLALSRRGVLRLVPPASPHVTQQFGRSGQWIRARVVRDRWVSPPRLGRVLTNVVWARQSQDVRAETLGSGSGEPQQRFTAARPPMLEGERVEVLEADGGWQTWARVADFTTSGPQDRHYVIDHVSGDVAFGDGSMGRPPPRGVDNVRVSYRSGGGAQGNRPAGAVSVLKRALPFIAGVGNPDPAEGGADAGDVASLLREDNAPLRHRGRAVAPRDFEDIAAAVSDEIARVVAIPPQFYSDNPADFDPAAAARGRGGWIASQLGRPEASELDGGGVVEVVVVPTDAAAQPVPGQGLLEAVSRALRARCAPNFTLSVRGPQWCEVRVAAELGASTSADAGDLLPRAEAALERFLHPLTGGADGRGWPFGRRPRDSDIQALLAGLPGLRFVRGLSVSCEPPLPMPEFLGLTHDPVHGELGRREAAGALVYSGAHALTLAEEG